jgi:hypothetical protein
MDEQDVTRVRVDQTVIVSPDSSPGSGFRGIVTSVARTMGRKAIRTGDPAEKSDRDVREVMTELQQDADVLPAGLRVTAQFLEK